MKTVLIVDDIPEYVDTMELNLPEDCRAIRAYTAEDAKAIFMKQSPDLVVIDIRLNEADSENREGLELLKWIKAAHPSVPVIMISAYRDFEYEAESLSLGAQFFIRKPVQPDEFQEFVKKAVRI